MAFLLHQLLEESASRHPDRDAITFGPRTLTYRELDRAAGDFAELVIGLGTTRGARVGIHLRRGVDAVIAMIGVLKAGAVYVPLEAQSPAGRMRYIIETCQIGVVVTVQRDLASLDEALGSTTPVRHIVVLDGTGPGERPAGVPVLVDRNAVAPGDGPRAMSPSAIDTDPAYILFTSGSTGAPKGVVISHLNGLTFINAAHEHFGISEDDRLSHVCPLQSDMSVFDIYVALRAGACIVGVPEMTAMFPVQLAQAIRSGGITVWNSVPSTLSSLTTLVNLETHDLSSLRLVLFAGEVFPLKALRRLMGAVPRARFCNMYGQTEANSSTYHWVGEIAEDARDPLPIGRALPNFEVFALDPDGRRVVAPGQEGELHVRASTVAAGYWGDPSRTAAAFIPHPLDPQARDRVYRTGDIVRLDENGEFVFAGRRDNMVKRSGYRVEIDEVEGALRNHPGIRNAAVIAIPDERIGNRLSAFIEPVVTGSLTKNEVIAYCFAELPRYMVPDEVAFRDALPLTSSGKVDRQRLAGS